MNPECPECKKEMKEDFGGVQDPDYDKMHDVLVGYKCECGYTCDTSGEDMQ